MMPGVPERRSHDYVRHGTMDLFAALNTATGKVIGQATAQHRHEEFLTFLKQVDRRPYPRVAVHIVCDNYATHNAPGRTTWLRHPRFTLHFTPTSSSWLNLVPVNRSSARRHARVS